MFGLRNTRGLAAAVVCCTAFTCSIVRSATISSPISLPGKLLTEKLGGPDRYLTFISTDKPIYRAGETVYLRGVLLNAKDHKPLGDNSGTDAVVAIKGPKGDVIATASVWTTDSVWSCGWLVPAGQAGGEYSVNVTYPSSGYTSAERKFDVRAYRAPRLKSQIKFMRDGYGPGDKVTATLDVKRAEGGVPEGAKVNVIARVDGIEIKGETAKVGPDGLCSVSFDLPRHIPRGEGTLALIVQDGGVVETVSKTIPILLQTVDLQIFPEGGDLIAGYSNRVYIEAKQPDGKPADITCKLMSKQSGHPIAVFHTEHEGRGRVEFTPKPNQSYFLAVSQPAGIKTVFPLPAIKASGAVVRAESDVFEAGQPIKISVGSTTPGARISLSKLEKEVSAFNLNASTVNGAVVPVAFNPGADVDGVLAVTVWDKNGKPLAERLVFRKSANPLKISVSADQKSYVPGGQARVTVKTTDSHGKPVSAVVGLDVTDDSVLEMIEKREQAPRLPVMVYLEPEVQDLADAHVYLDSSNPKAPRAIDLLLGTQGWRRFALVNLPEFLKQNGDAAARAVAFKDPTAMERFRQPDLDAAVAGMPGRGAFEVGQAQLAAVPAPLPMGAANAPIAPMQKRSAVMPSFSEHDVLKEMPVAKPMLKAEKQVEAKDLVDNKLVLRDIRQAAVGRIVANAKRRAEPLSDCEQQEGSLLLVREFAHQVRKDRKPTDRVDFAETLYFNSDVKTDAKTGTATVAFGLSDSVSTFRVFADGFNHGGAIGATDIGVQSKQPFYAEAKMPLEVTAGDRVLMPITMVNGTPNSLTGAQLSASLQGDSKIEQIQKASSTLTPDGRVRWIQPIHIGTATGAKNFSFNAKAGTYHDGVTRTLTVAARGFPFEAGFGGMLQPNRSVIQTITIPQTISPNSASSTIVVYPSPLANMTGALERMIQDPYGCFEQTSSTSYPLTMAQQYFLSHANVDPKLVAQSRQKLDASYKRLLSFWCPDRGYEWFGENPGHEALTAFGLLHFCDMSKVRDVDQSMVASTRTWLLKQKDGQGGFTRKRRSLHTWIEDKDDSNAYIDWALLESGTKPAELKPELASLQSTADKSSNSYVLALAANAMHLSGEKAEATKLMSRLAAKQNNDGSVDGIKSSIVGSEGDSLKIEGTALAALAWMRDPAYAGNVERSMKFLADSCKDGRYGTTQSTVLALRAIVAYDQQKSMSTVPGKVRILVDGHQVGDWVSFNKNTQGAVTLPNVGELMSPGKHKLELCMEGGIPLPYSMAVKYNAITPDSDANCKLDLSVKMAQSKITEGASTEANVTVTNKTKKAVPSPVAIVGLPGGMEPRHDQLKELVKKGTIDAYEVRGRDVVLYWRSMTASQTVNVPVSLIAAVPGTYTAPASRAYLYYGDEHKRWVAGSVVEIVAR